MVGRWMPTEAQLAERVIALETTVDLLQTAMEGLTTIKEQHREAISQLGAHGFAQSDHLAGVVIALAHLIGDGPVSPDLAHVQKNVEGCRARLNSFHKHRKRVREILAKITHPMDSPSNVEVDGDVH